MILKPNAAELALIAQEIGAMVVRWRLRRTGGREMEQDDRFDLGFAQNKAERLRAQRVNLASGV